MNTRTFHSNPRNAEELQDVKDLREALARDERDLFLALRNAARDGTDTPSQRQALLDQYERAVRQLVEVDETLEAYAKVEEENRLEELVHADEDSAADLAADRAFAREGYNWRD